MIISNNNVSVSGIIKSVDFSHSCHGEQFYLVNLAVERLSGVNDIVPCILSDRVFKVSKDYIGNPVKVIGQYRSYSKKENGNKRLLLFVFVQSFIPGTLEDINHIKLKGYICKPPTFRKTPLGKEISDLLIAVTRGFNKIDYIPCVAWGNNAIYSSSLNIGDFVTVQGRMQSRVYVKDNQNKMAYEMSINSIESYY